MNLGLEIGSDFNKGPSSIGGCYAYNNQNTDYGGKVFYGDTKALTAAGDPSAPVQEKDQFRPLGHDCKSNIRLIHFIISVHIWHYYFQQFVSNKF